jgi:hypothetical protein
MGISFSPSYQGQTIARHGEVRAFPIPTYFGKALMDVRFIFLSIIDTTGYKSIYPDREERYKERYIYKLVHLMQIMHLMQIVISVTYSTVTCHLLRRAR